MIHQTAAEYLREKIGETSMENIMEFANRCFQAHKAAFEQWEHGDIKEIEKGEGGVVCIKYNSGTWWHYAEKKEQIIWW